MWDRAVQAALQPAMHRMGLALASRGVGADALSLLGFAIGVGAGAAIALQHYHWGLSLLLLSRLFDGLDGAVARASEPTDRGGFLDITLDFLFYATIPLAFALANPPVNALPAAVLLAAFMGTGSSFLAFAALAQKRGLSESVPSGKSFYFLGGLTEASETITVFAAMCLWPDWFAPLAYGFALLCAFTLVFRIGWGWWRLG